MTIPSTWKLGLALGFGLLIGLANVGKNVHIDDTLYLEVARRITTHPGDPYGGTLNWQQVPELTYNVSISPPLLSYWFAGVILVAGENIPLLHMSMIPWLLMACWALFQLGERWASAGLTTVLLVVGGPAVVVGMNLMLDVPLLACMCMSMECLTQVESGQWPRRSLLLAALFASVGVGIKFAGLAIVPVFLVAGLTKRRWGMAIAAVGPIATLIGWQTISRSLYGVSQIDAGMSFLSKLQTSLLSQSIQRTLTMMAILGSTLPLWLAVPWKRRRSVGQYLLAGLATAVAAWLLRSTPMNRLPMVTPAFLVAVFLGTFSMIAILWPTRNWPTGGWDPRLLLTTWIASGAAVVILFGPFVAVRSFLPIHPPLVIWLLGSQEPGQPRRGAVRISVMFTLLLSALLAWTDIRWANCYSEAAQQISRRYQDSNRSILFLGHWGWQFYAQREGFQAWDARRRSAPAGTIVVIPVRADKQFIQPAVFNQLHRLDQIVIPANPVRLTTWNRNSGFRFYGGDFGQLPWGFSSEPTELFTIYEVVSGTGSNISQ